MPDTPVNRLRRIDAVLQQGEAKFALGRHAEHIAALEGIRTMVDEAADPRRRATWYYLFVVLGFNLFGDGPRDILDPRLAEE